jgi:UDP-N-acetylmuramoyl-L-alanyl-D-glutamate--2,6-diaminopimelate ligase
MAMAKKLGEILKSYAIAKTAGSLDREIPGICSDSRKVTPGCLFACVKGGNVDGHDFAEDAVRQGAGAVLADRELDLPSSAALVVVGNVRKALAYVSSVFYDNPSHELTVVGITGTNGKTTTAHFVKAIVEDAGQKAGVMGTLGHYVGDAYEKDPFTTPEPPEVHRYLRSMVESGLTYCAMEVSSHALALHRADYVDFDVVCFTNLTRDHLDFHGGFDQYKRAKMSLFEAGAASAFGDNRKAVVNLCDDTGVEIAQTSALPCLTYCLGKDADVRGDILSMERQGSRLKVSHAQGATMVKTVLQGRMNVENALAAFAIGLTLGFDEDAILAGIAGLEQLPGRVEVISGKGRSAVVDYAHTPDALSRLLTDMRDLTSKRVISVFGCGGDRDQGKRPEMGRIGAELSDLVIITSDNPRTEDPQKIIDDIVSGLPEGSSYEVEPDRERAIEKAIQASDEGDLIVVAGKGHEDYQILGTRKIHFDDREIVRKLLGDIANAEAQHS